jgi:hypothetical protein
MKIRNIVAGLGLLASVFACSTASALTMWQSQTSTIDQTAYITAVYGAFATDDLNSNGVITADEISQHADVPYGATFAGVRISGVGGAPVELTWGNFQLVHAVYNWRYAVGDFTGIFAGGSIEWSGDASGGLLTVTAGGNDPVAYATTGFLMQPMPDAGQTAGLIAFALVGLGLIRRRLSTA